MAVSLDIQTSRLYEEMCDKKEENADGYAN
jgi:hypothetical protein